MSAVRMAAAELRRLTSSRLPRLAVVAMLCVPVLYGGLYLYANHDPYGRLDRVPAAVVDLDAGATVDGKAVHLGRQVSDELLRGQALDWHRVSAAQAEQGVRDGRYDVALTLPPDFSADITSSQQAVGGAAAAQQAQLELTTNDANNYLARTIANTVTDRVRDSLAAQVGQRAADSFLLGFSDVHDQLAKAADGADDLADGAPGAHAAAPTSCAPAPPRSPPGSSDCSPGARSSRPRPGTPPPVPVRSRTAPGRLSDGPGHLAAQHEHAAGRLPAAGGRRSQGRRRQPAAVAGGWPARAGVAGRGRRLGRSRAAGAGRPARRRADRRRSSPS